ncbi:unnamed protein product, partial [Effrenium voratum]
YGARGCGQWGRAAELAAGQLRYNPSLPRTATASSDEASKVTHTATMAGRRMSGVLQSKVAQMQLALELQGEAAVPTTPPRPTPMVCPRCLKADLPTFPYVSVGELLRSHTEAEGMDDRSPASSTESRGHEGDSVQDEHQAGAFSNSRV